MYSEYFNDLFENEIHKSFLKHYYTYQWLITHVFFCLINDMNTSTKQNNKKKQIGATFLNLHEYIWLFKCGDNEWKSIYRFGKISPSSCLNIRLFAQWITMN